MNSREKNSLVKKMQNGNVSIIVGKLGRKNENSRPEQCFLCETIIFLTADELQMTVEQSKIHPTCPVCAYDIMTTFASAEKPILIGVRQQEEHYLKELVQARRVSELPHRPAEALG